MMTDDKPPDTPSPSVPLNDWDICKCGHYWRTHHSTVPVCAGWMPAGFGGPVNCPCQEFRLQSARAQPVSVPETPSATPEAELMALARDIGTVRDVAARRSDGDADHQQMLRRLDAWTKTVWDARDSTQQLRAELTRLRAELANATAGLGRGMKRAD